MIQDYCVDLNIDVSNALRNDLNIKDFRKKPTSLWHYTKNDLTDIFNPAWIESIKNLGLVPIGCLIFYREPYNFSSSIHVDVKTNPLETVNYAVNFVFDPQDDSEMIWYELANKDPSFKEVIEYTKSGIPYCSWDLKKFHGKEVARKTIGKNLILVNTSVPHTVETFEKERLSFSIRFSDFYDISYQDAVKKFTNIC